MFWPARLSIITITTTGRFWAERDVDREANETLERTYVYGTYIDEVLAMKDASDSYLRYYLHGHLYLLRPSGGNDSSDSSLRSE
jgi:hypothetical protein